MATNTTRPSKRSLVRKTTRRPPYISLGTLEKALLGAVFEEGFHFTRRGYASAHKKAPSSVYDALCRLVAKGYLEKPHLGTYAVTDAGIKILGSKNVGSKGRQKACRGRDSRSMHAIKFDFHIKTKSFFDPDGLDKIGSVSDPVNMQGWSYYRVDIDDCSLNIFPSKVVCLMSEITGDDFEKNAIEAIDKAAGICQKLSTVGLICDVISLSRAEFARVECVLAQVLTKKLGKYRYVLKDGSVFWIDFSGNKIESESDNIKLASRVDDFVEDLKDSESLFSDVDAISTDVEGLKKVAHMVLQHDVNMIRMQQLQKMQQPPDQKNIGDYFG